MMILGEGTLGRNRFSWSFESGATNHGISVLEKKRGLLSSPSSPHSLSSYFLPCKTQEEGSGIQPSASIPVSSSFLLLRTAVSHHLECCKIRLLLLASVTISAELREALRIAESSTQSEREEDRRVKIKHSTVWTPSKAAYGAQQACVSFICQFQKKLQICLQFRNPLALCITNFFSHKTFSDLTFSEGSKFTSLVSSCCLGSWWSCSKNTKTGDYPPKAQVGHRPRVLWISE